jgi:hypothetical protein
LRIEATPGREVMRPYLEKNPTQKRADGVTQGIGPEFKPQHHKKKKETKLNKQKSKHNFLPSQNLQSLK